MNILLKSSKAWFCAALMTLGLTTTQAQTTANWIGPASGGEWNDGTNWDTGFPPLDATTNAFIGNGSNVNYNLPMSTTGFGILTNNGELNVNAAGFNSSAIIMNAPTVSKILLITNSGAAVNVSGNLTMGTNCLGGLSPGASLTVGGAFVLAASESSAANNSCLFTNRGGTLIASSTTVNNNGGTGTGLLMISGGTNSLGNTAVGRYHGTSASTPGTEGLAITGGLVTMTNLNLGNAGVGASFLTGLISGGIVTNYGSVSINNLTAGRYSRLLQTGGIFVVPDPGLVNPNSTTAGAVTSIYSVTGGTNIVGGFYFGNSNNPVGATAQFTNSAIIYVGSQGIAGNGASINTLSLNNGGMLGATADWIGSLDMILNGGTFTFQAAAQDGTPQNIRIAGALRGSGALSKIGGGTLTLASSNIYSGITLIKNGTLALDTDVSGTVGSLLSPAIIVGSGTTFDVSQTTAYSVNPLQTLSGFGTVAGTVTVAPAGILNPGSNALTGTLTFNNDVVETNGAVNHFDVPGDAINILGTLNVTGSNVMEIAGSLTPGAPYALVHYGALSGDVSNFGLSGATGTLSNSVIDKTIYLVVTSSLRASTNLTWVGNGVVNDWDTHNATNWIDGTTGPLDFFLSGDNVRFDNLGGNNTNVNIPGTVIPASVVVDSTSNYVFSGAGLISGSSTTLTKTNSGTLTILTTNTYAGVTTFAGGVVDVLSIANGGIPSPLGAASADPSSIVFNGGTLEYLGGNQSIDHGATIQSGGAILSVSNAGNTLTISGTLTGSGSLTKIGNGQLTLSAPSDFQGGTVINAGTIRAAQGSGATISALGTNVINLNGDASAATFLFGGDAEVLNNTLNIVNTNNFISNGGNDQVLNVTGNGLVNLEGTGANVLTFAGDMTAFSGTFYVDTLPNARFLPNSGSISGGTNVTFNLGVGSGLLNNRNGNLTVLLGSLYGGPSTLAQGGSTSSSDNRPTTYIIGGNNSSSEFDGIFSEQSLIHKVSLVKSGTGVFILTGQNSYSGFTTVSNGVLALVGSGAIDFTTNINIGAGAVLDVSARGDTTLNLNSAQVLQGSGTLAGTLNNSGTVAPGDGLGGNTGTLTVTNIANLFSMTWMKLNRDSAPNSDKLVAPTINLGGTLVVTNSGAPLHVGDTFTLFSGTLTGSFGAVILPNYYTFDTTQLAVNGTLTVTSYSPPGLAADFSAFSSGAITFNATNGFPGGTLSVLTSTNLTTPTSNWTAVATGNFDGNGDFTAPVTVDPTVPNQFFILSAQ